MNDAAPQSIQPKGETLRQSCAFCGTTPNGGDKSCATYEEAIARTSHHPFGCPWFTRQDRAEFTARMMSNLDGEKDAQIAALSSRIAELESNERAYEAALGQRTYNEVAEHIAGLEKALREMATWANLKDSTPAESLSGEEVMYEEGYSAALRAAGKFALAVLTSPPEVTRG